jgi:hypothetical protein
MKILVIDEHQLYVEGMRALQKYCPNESLNNKRLTQ